MIDSTVESVLALHTDFWNRELEQPVINIDCSMWKRTQYVSALPPEWEEQDNLTLEPDMLSPEKFQPAPMILDSEDNTRGEVAFNTLFPYNRIPWVAGIIGCDLKVSAFARTVWPQSYVGDNWYELENQGFAPRLEWLDKLLEFVSYIVDCYYPDQCIPTLDVIARGPGDLALHMLGAERLYLGFYDHPDEVKLLLNQITDLYIRWAQAQLEIIPRVHGGYCNQYGIWTPGTCLRTQENYAAYTLSPQLFKEFLMPSVRSRVEAFEYPVFHTHSSFPQIAEWVLSIDKLKAIEVSLDPTVDPTVPSIEEQIPLWNRILKKKCLIIEGPVTQRQLDMLVSSLSPDGLWLDVEVVTQEELATTAWEWDKSKRYEDIEKRG